MFQMFNECIRLNEYESAFALTDFAVNLQCSRLYHQPLVKVRLLFYLSIIANTLEVC